MIRHRLKVVVGRQVRLFGENVREAKGGMGWVEEPGDTAIGSKARNFRGQANLPTATEGRVIELQDSEVRKKVVVSQDHPDMVLTRMDLDQGYFFQEEDEIGHPPIPNELVESSLSGTDMRHAAAGEYIIPAMLKLKDRDIIYSSVTGSGKTMAYILALLQLVSEEERGISLVLVPSRELALQVYSHCLRWSEKGAKFNRNDKEWLQIHLQDPNEDMQRLHDDYKRLQSTWYGGARVVIAQPERWADYLLHWRLTVPIRRVVIDEAFTCFDPIDATKAPLSKRQHRDINPNPTDIIMSYYLAFPAFKTLMRAQVILLTATFTEALQKHVVRYLKANQWTHLTTRQLIPPHIEYSFLPVPEDRLVSTFLSTAFEMNPSRAVVFVDDDESIERVYENMVEAGMNVRMFDLGDGKLPPFQDYSWQYLLLREQVAYGLDIKNVSHVFITHCPSSMEAFCHMAGRTGRFGNMGKVVSFIENTDKLQWHAQMHLLDIKIGSENGADIEEEVTNEIALMAEEEQRSALVENEIRISNRVMKKKKLLYTLARQKGELWKAEAPVGSIARVLEENVQATPVGSMAPDEIDAWREEQRREFQRVAGQHEIVVHSERRLQYKEMNIDPLERYGLAKGFKHVNNFKGLKKRYEKSVKLTRSKFSIVREWSNKRLMANFNTVQLAPDGSDPSPTMPPVSRKISNDGSYKKWANFRDLPPYPGYQVLKHEGRFDHDAFEEDAKKYDASTEDVQHMRSIKE
eukprot:TRINITY_DN13647_c0_g1_i2.p1 TRINITY_DN13647_c0_g1~~TRINITY_DN13647_c0_g1_i2.p1  ORF type:complete len:746 (+),score=194.25 TRINITY_DN13647_c0_g1_i2:1803-4040(+)